VISRTSVERLNPNLSIPEIGALLGVATVLEGQVQRAGNRLRINVQLIDTAVEGHIWANTYDSELTAENIFEVQGDIARTIANALQAELSPNDEQVLSAVPTTSTEALEKYLLAMQISKRFTYESLQQAETYLEQSTALDPAFTDARIGLAYIRGEMFQTGAIGLEEYIDGAGSAIRTALSLNPRNGEAHAVFAQVQNAEGKTRSAEASFKEALRAAPRSSLVHKSYGQFLQLHGRLEEARRILKRGLEIDPLSPDMMFQLGRVEMYLGNPDANIEVANRILELDPLSVQGYVIMLQANLWRGRLDETWPWYVKAIGIDPGDHEIWGHMAVFLHNLGAEELSDRYMERAESRGKGEPVTVKCRIQILSTRGQTSEALELANTYLTDEFDNRWRSHDVLLRTIANDAIRYGRFEDILELYQRSHPELFKFEPEISSDNVWIAADLAGLLQRAGDPDGAKKVIDAALHWYRSTQPEGVHGYKFGIVDVQLLALAGETDLALTTLRDAVDKGWRWEWQWDLSNVNLDILRSTPEFQQIIADIEEDMAAQRQTVLASPHLGEFDLRDKPAE